jgi:hypothetical protein
MAQFAAAAMVVSSLAGLALVIPRRAGALEQGWIPSAWAMGVLALLFGSAALFVPKDWGWGAVAALLYLDLTMLVLVLVWSRRSTWGMKHRLALAAGAALAYGWHAFLQHPAVGEMDKSVRIGNTIFLLGAIGLIWFASRRTNTAQQAATREAA